MKIIIEITDSDTKDMVSFNFRLKGKSASLPVLRAVARMSRAITAEFQNIHGESEIVKEMMKKKESEK
jgi:hypothetical protein